MASSPAINNNKLYVISQLCVESCVCKLVEMAMCVMVNNVMAV